MIVRNRETNPSCAELSRSLVNAMVDKILRFRRIKAGSAARDRGLRAGHITNMRCPGLREIKARLREASRFFRDVPDPVDWAARGHRIHHEKPGSIHPQRPPGQPRYRRRADAVMGPAHRSGAVFPANDLWRRCRKTHARVGTPAASPQTRL